MHGRKTYLDAIIVYLINGLHLVYWDLLDKILMKQVIVEQINLTLEKGHKVLE